MILILCEDKNSYCFIYRFLIEKGIGRREIRHHKPHKEGDGSGESWVCEHYPDALNIARKTKQPLVVCTDADAGTVEERIAGLNSKCRKDKISPRKSDDPVALIIPKWNIETWIKHLNGEDVHEDRKYQGSHEADGEKCKSAVNKLIENCRKLRQTPPQKLDKPFLSSLKRVCTEKEVERVLPHI
jgi:hypothetical protein